MTYSASDIINFAASAFLQALLWPSHLPNNALNSANVAT